MILILVSIHVLKDQSRSNRKNKIPYPIERLEHFDNDGIYCKILLHAILIKHIRNNLSNLLLMRCHQSKELRSISKFINNIIT